MDANVDVLMHEDGIFGTTELNGHTETVDPSAIVLNQEEIQSPILTTKEHLPLLSHDSPPHELPPHLDQFDGAFPSDAPPPIHQDHERDHDTDTDTTDSVLASDIMEEDDVIDSPRHVVQVVIPRIPKVAALPYSSSQSGLVYDVRMRFHTEPISSMIDEDDIHPEEPRRILEIFDELVNAGLVADPKFPDLDPETQLLRIEPRFASRREICLVHNQEHYDWVKSLARKEEDELNEMAKHLDSVYLHPSTYFCAKLSAGGAIEACRAVVGGAVKNAIAVIRPPGHHAEVDQPGGFCFFNNVPIAAKVCQEDFPDTCRKILILDWDVHHGNGVQQAFEDDPNVLYISLHVHKNGTFYPNGPYGDHLHCGIGRGIGRNVNIPWADHGMGDGDYMYAFQNVVMPIATEFAPDLVIVSAGFDAAEGDRLGGCHVSPPCYAHMTHMLKSLAGGKICVCLEGGYNLRSIAKSALAVTRTLMGEPPDRLGEVTPSALGVSTVQLVMRTQAKYWKCMYPKDTGLKPTPGVPGQRLHDIIRSWQSKMLWEECRMAPLLIVRDRVSTSFKDQVVATKNFMEARPLLVILHDPPEVHGIPDPRTNKLELHNTWLTDATKTYIDWAIGQGFGVIDVNIPKYITEQDDEGGYIEPDALEDRGSAARELVTYLWQNYIEISDATDVFFIGVGAAHSGILELLNTEESTTDDASNIRNIICFVSEGPLVSVKRPTDDYIAGWYWSRSLVFVAPTHLAWDPTRHRKARKKYGNLVKSTVSGLNDMLLEHKDQVFSLILAATEEWRESEFRKHEVDRNRLEKEEIKAVAGQLGGPGSAAWELSRVVGEHFHGRNGNGHHRGLSGNGNGGGHTASSVPPPFTSAPSLGVGVPMERSRSGNSIGVGGGHGGGYGSGAGRGRTMSPAAAGQAPAALPPLQSSPRGPPIGYFTPGPGSSPQPPSRSPGKR